MVLYVYIYLRMITGNYKLINIHGPVATEPPGQGVNWPPLF